VSSTAARTTRARRTAVIAVTMMTVGAAAVIAPTSAIVAANAAGVAPAAVSASSLAGAVTAAGASAVVATSATTTPAPRATTASRSTTRTAVAPYRVGTRAYSKWFARTHMAKRFGWKSQRQYQCLVNLWKRESGWRHKAHNSSSGAHGIPQALPGSKMASAGPNWRSNPRTQIKWGLKYINGRYGSPCGAWSHWLNRHWY
jgi:Transglycosylase SLT domain